RPRDAGEDRRRIRRLRPAPAESGCLTGPRARLPACTPWRSLNCPADFSRSFRMAAFRTLDNADVKGKRALLRVDLNVPVQDGRVTDATRIERIAGTIPELAGKGAKVVLLAHFGRPKGKADPGQSLKPIAEATEAVLGRKVGFAADCIGPAAA